MSSRSHATAALVAALLSLIVVAQATAARKDAVGPRPISPAEAAAVEMVADFLVRGPVAVHERLSPDSPLAALPVEDALEEIEARMGPPDGAEWRLQTIVPSLADRGAVFGVQFPSGIDDIVEVSLVPRDERFEIFSLRSLSEPSPYAFRAEWMNEEADTGTVTEAPFSLLGHLPVLGLVIALLSVASLLLARLRPVYGKAMITATMLASILALTFVVGEIDEFVTRDDASLTTEAAAVAIDRLGSLAAERRLLASGGPMAAVPDVDSPARDIALIWKAQVALRDQNPEEAARTLEHFPLSTDRPMVALLRARLAAATYDEIAASLAYERAMRLGPGRDDLWFETAQWLYALGFEERAIGYLNRLPAMRSRNAEVYYALASVAGTRRREPEAISHLKAAWELEPVPRSRIISTPTLTFTMRIDDTAMIPFSAESEPVFRAEPDPALGVVLPDSATTTVVGSLLSIRIGSDRSLRVDGGAPLVGPDTEVVDAVTAERRDEERYLLDFPGLLASAGSPSDLAQPAMRERYLRTATALAEKHRWDDVERLTTSLSAKADNVPLDLLFLRGTALRKLRRETEARRLLAEMVASPTMARRSDPRALYQLGEMLAAMELYPAAIRTLERVDAMLDDVSLDDRIRQLSMNQRLAERYAELTSPNFVFHYPDDIDSATMKRLSEIMEAELARLKKVIPVTEFRPTTVNILWWSEFRNTYTGSDHILGFYDGKITLPLAGISRMNPSVVALATHELAHAVIAQATDDRAPAWLQEGLAQRVEMIPYHANAFNMYESDRLLPITLLDPSLTDSVDGNLVGQAYITSQTVVRFLESKYGAKMIPSLLSSIRDGQSDEAALTTLTGKTIEALEIEFREWGRADRRVFENQDLVRYDGAGDEPRVRFSKRPPGKN